MTERRTPWQTLSQSLAELEATDPAVKAAAEEYDARRGCSGTRRLVACCSSRSWPGGGGGWRVTEGTTTQPFVKREFPNVRLMIADTGEVMQWAMAGDDGDEFDGSYPWEQTSLQLALNLVPHLMDAIDRCRIRGQWAEIRIDPGVTS